MLKKILKLFKPKPRIAILRLSGVIGNVGFGRNGMSLSSLDQLIKDAFSKPKTRAVCLAINSPGGSPVQSELIATRIKELSIEKSIPVYSFVEDVAASGGYWLACIGEEIYASRSSIIGSIGVITSGFGLKEAIKKLGIERRVITQGKNKSILDPFSDMKKEDTQIITNLQEDTHKHFIEYVQESRKDKLKASDEDLFSGEFWSGKKALEYGLIDGIQNMHSFIKNKFGNRVKIEYISQKESWFKKMFFSKITANELADAFYGKCEEEISYSKLYMR